ncbi:MAG: hypothetical protein V1739_00855 [Candidatus Omnitrophota bacterium]
MTWKCFSNQTGKYLNLLYTEETVQKSAQQQYSENYLTSFRNKIRYSMQKSKNSDILVFWGGGSRGKRA